MITEECVSGVMTREEVAGGWVAQEYLVGKCEGILEACSLSSRYSSMASASSLENWGPY